MWSTFEKINARKCHGPDGISSRLIKCCTPFSSEVFTYIFQWSLSLNKVPTLWKESIIVPVPKVPSPENLNYYCPVALTSVVMKSFEHIVKKNVFFFYDADCDGSPPTCLPTQERGGGCCGDTTELGRKAFGGQEDTYIYVLMISPRPPTVCCILV